MTLRGKQTRQTRVSRDARQELGRSQVQLRSCSCWRREERKDLNRSTFAFLYPVIMSAEPKIQYVLHFYESSELFLSLSGRGIMLTMCLHLEICSTSPRASSRTCLPVSFSAPHPSIAYRIASYESFGRQLTIPVNMRSLWWRNMK